MAVDTTKVQAFVQALLDKFENKVANKKDDISGDFSTDSVSYPTVKAVKNYITTALTGKADTTHAHGNLTSAGKIGTSSGKIITTGTGGALQASDSITKSQISDFPTSMTPTSHTHGDITNDGKLGSTSGKIVTTGTGGKLQASESITKSLISDFPSTMDPTSHTHGNLTNDGKLGTTANKPVITGTGGAITVGSFGSTSGTFAEGNHTHSQYLTEHQSLAGTVVTLEEQSTAETGYAKTYVIKQGGTAISPKINIPKDFLVKSGQVKTCTTANVPVQGYVVGDKYIDFVINAKDSSATDEHMYIFVSDLVEDTQYGVDEVTLASYTSNGITKFKVKDGGIGTTQLSSSVNTILGYASNWNSSPAHGITSTQIESWDTAVAGGITISDVDDEIDDYLDAITTALSS